MATTTIRLPEELKERIARAAEREGVSPHAFILDALAAHIAEEERRHEFHEIAERRYAQIVASGKTISWSEMRTYLKNRIADQTASPPAPKRMGG